MAVAAAALVVLATRVRDWVVMTDELQYAKLATHIGQTLSPLPTLRGVHVSTYAQLYPALLAPFYGTLSDPSAFRAAHVLNAVLFASAAVPAYLLGRELALSRGWGVVCAAFAVVVPWNVLTAFVMLSLVPLTGWANQISLAQITLVGCGAFAMVEWGFNGNALSLLIAPPSPGTSYRLGRPTTSPGRQPRRRVALPPGAHAPEYPGQPRYLLV